MWFMAALFVAGFLLTAFLAPKAKIENAKASNLSDFNFPRAKEGDPVPRLYGTIKTAGVNTIAVCNFKSVAIKKKVKTGLFSSKKQTIGYKYYAGINLAVALGPGFVFRRIWFGDHLIWAGCLYAGACENVVNVNLPNVLGGQDKNGGLVGNIALYCGNFNQNQDPYLLANVDPEIPAYNGIAHMVFRDFYWGNSPNIEAITVEGSYFSNSLGLPGGIHVMPNGLDANPIEVLYDLYVNGWGNLAVNPALMDVTTWRAAAQIVYNENNGMSLEIGNPNTGADLSKEILRQVNGLIYQDPSTGVIKLKLMRKDYVVATLPVLGPGSIKSVNNFTKKLWEDTFNRVRVKFTDRNNNYARDAIATDEDTSNIRFQGRMKATDVAFPGVYNFPLANTLAARELSNLNVPLFQAELILDRTHTDLTPGDVFVWQWPEYGITSMVMRVRKMGLGNRKDGKVSMTVVQDEYAVDATVMGVPTATISDSASYSPTDIAAFQYIELPYWLNNASRLDTRAGYTRYAAFALKPGAASLDFFAYIVDAANGDVEALSNAGYSYTAKLNAALAKFANFADGKVPTLVIKNLSNPSILTNGSAATVKSDGHGLFLLNGELLAYETYVDNLDGTYTLNNVYRALMDTAWTGGAANDVLYFFDGQEGFLDSDVPATPFTAYLVDRSSTGRSAVATAPHTLLTPVGRASLPLPPDALQMAGNRALEAWFAAGSTVALTWADRNRTAPAIALETDATTAPEAGTTYKVQVVKASDGTVLFTDAAVAAQPYNLALDAGLPACAAILKLWAVNGGNLSFASTDFPFYITTDATLFVDGDPVIVDGSTVEF